MNHILRLTRLGIWINEEFLLMAVFGLLIFSSGQVLLAKFLLFYLFGLSFGYTLNTYLDRKQDHKAGKRLLYPYDWSSKTTRLFTWLLALLSIAAATLFMDVMLFILSVVALLIAYLYSYTLKEKGLLGIMAAALSQFALPALILAWGNEVALLAFMWFLLYGINDVLIHQIEDFESDSFFFSGVFAARYGKAAAIKITQIIILMLVIASFFIAKGFFVLIPLIFIAGQYKDLSMTHMSKKRRSINLSLGDSLEYAKENLETISNIRKHSSRIIFSGAEPFTTIAYKHATEASQGLEIELMTTGRPFADAQNVQVAMEDIGNFLIYTRGEFDREFVNGVENLMMAGANVSFLIFVDNINVTELDRIMGFISEFRPQALHIKALPPYTKKMLGKLKGIKGLSVKNHFLKCKYFHDKGKKLGCEDCEIFCEDE